MPKFAANLTMLFNEVDFLARFDAAAKAGFRGVEYLFPYPFPKEALAEQLARHGLTQVLHNLPAGDWAKGERGIACIPGREAEFREGVEPGALLREGARVPPAELPCRRPAEGRRARQGSRAPSSATCASRRANSKAPGSGCSSSRSILTIFPAFISAAPTRR